MSTFCLQILGTSAALPAYGRNPTAQVLQIAERLFLFDCGEGTQAQMQRYRVRKSKIEAIFITHLHGDHVFGLIGLLTSYSLEGRSQKMDIYGPAGLEEMMNVQLQYSGGGYSYPVHFHVVDTESAGLLWEDDQVEVYHFPLKHRIPTSGYRINEKRRPRNMIKEKIAEYQIPYLKIPGIKTGNDFETEDGTIIPNAELTTAPPLPRSFAFCTDTLFHEELAPYITGVDLLYHESTYCDDLEDQAAISMHSTATQAARMAHLAKAKKLILGHYSARYKTIECFEEEARAIFPQSITGVEGGTYEVPQLRP